MVRPWYKRGVPDWLWLGVIVALTVGLRVLWIVRAETYPVPGMDPLFYDETARRLAAGLGYTHHLDGAPTALFPPGYPFALGGIYKVFGASLAVGQAFNVCVAVTVVLATYAVGRLAIGRSAALLGAFLWAVFPSQVIWSSLLMPELLFTFALMLSLVFIFVSNRLSSREQAVAAAQGGLLAGAAALIRGQAIGLWLVLALWMWFQRRPNALRNAALYALAMALMLLPWAVRNLKALDAPVLVSTNIGWNAVIGHSDYADGGFWSPAASGVFHKYVAPNPVGEVERNEAGIRMAVDWAFSHPGKELELAFKKTAILWQDDADAVWWQEAGRPPFIGSAERRGLTIFSNLFYYAILLMAGIGLVGGLRRSEPWALLLLLIMLYWTIFHILFFSENRFHYPLAPLLSLAAAGAGTRLSLTTGVVRARIRTGLAPSQRARYHESRRGTPTLRGAGGAGAG